MTLVPIISSNSAAAAAAPGGGIEDDSCIGNAACNPILTASSLPTDLVPLYGGDFVDAAAGAPSPVIARLLPGVSLGEVAALCSELSDPLQGRFHGNCSLQSTASAAAHAQSIVTDPATPVDWPFLSISAQSEADLKAMRRALQNVVEYFDRDKTATITTVGAPHFENTKYTGDRNEAAARPGIVIDAHEEKKQPCSHHSSATEEGADVTAASPSHNHSSALCKCRVKGASAIDEASTTDKNETASIIPPCPAAGKHSPMEKKHNEESSTPQSGRPPKLRSGPQVEEEMPLHEGRASTAAAAGVGKKENVSTNPSPSSPQFVFSPSLELNVATNVETLDETRHLDANSALLVEEENLAAAGRSTGSPLLLQPEGAEKNGTASTETPTSESPLPPPVLPEEEVTAEENGTASTETPTTESPLSPPLVPEHAKLVAISNSTKAAAPESSAGSLGLKEVFATGACVITWK